MHISFSEILVILLVALLVLKPEQLPGAALKLGQWMRWFRRTSQQLKEEIEKPLQAITSMDFQKESPKKISRVIKLPSMRRMTANKLLDEIQE